MTTNLPPITTTRSDLLNLLRQVLAMLLADAQLNGSAWSNSSTSSNGGNGSGSQQRAPPALPHLPAGARLGELWALQVRFRVSTVG